MKCSQSHCAHDARSRLDRVGIFLSGACAIHCIAGLAVVGLLGLGGQYVLAPEIHEFGLVAAIVVGALTIGLGALRHGNLLPLLLGTLGIALMGIAVAGPHGLGEAVLTVAGVGLLAVGHFLNIRACSPGR